jgi:hypothetical protein
MHNLETLEEGLNHCSSLASATKRYRLAATFEKETIGLSVNNVSAACRQISYRGLCQELDFLEEDKCCCCWWWCNLHVIFDEAQS